MQQAGEEGSYVHDAIHSLLRGGWLALRAESWENAATCLKRA